ncbi:hypothetical protein Ct61P_04708 [Colletotrichum tofieldiae]|nr:hypothetical protein Ct61P_04708 [Colletotrichum tofieldiae]
METVAMEVTKTTKRVGLRSIIIVPTLLEACSHDTRAQQAGGRGEDHVLPSEEALEPQKWKYVSSYIKSGATLVAKLDGQRTPSSYLLQAAIYNLIKECQGQEGWTLNLVVMASLEMPSGDVFGKLPFPCEELGYWLEQSLSVEATRISKQFCKVPEEVNWDELLMALVTVVEEKFGTIPNSDCTIVWMREPFQCMDAIEERNWAVINGQDAASMDTLMKIPHPCSASEGTNDGPGDKSEPPKANERTGMKLIIFMEPSKPNLCSFPLPNVQLVIMSDRCERLAFDVFTSHVLIKTMRLSRSELYLQAAFRHKSMGPPQDVVLHSDFDIHEAIEQSAPDPIPATENDAMVEWSFKCIRQWPNKPMSEWPVVSPHHARALKETMRRLQRLGVIKAGSRNGSWQLPRGWPVLSGGT